MRVVDRELAAYGHHEPSPDDREVERLSVVRGARAKRLDLGLQRGDEGALRSEIEQEMLAQHQLPIGEVSDSNEKDVRSRATREPRRLRVEEEHVLPSAGGSALEAK